MNSLQVTPAARLPRFTGGLLSGNSIVKKPIELYLQLEAVCMYKRLVQDPMLIPRPFDGVASIQHVDTVTFLLLLQY